MYDKAAANFKSRKIHIKLDNTEEIGQRYRESVRCFESQLVRETRHLLDAPPTLRIIVIDLDMFRQLVATLVRRCSRCKLDLRRLYMLRTLVRSTVSPSCVRLMWTNAGGQGVAVSFTLTRWRPLGRIRLPYLVCSALEELITNQHDDAHREHQAGGLFDRGRPRLPRI